MVGNQPAEKIPRRVTHRQAADVVADGMIAVLIRRQRIDVERHVERRHRAVSKAVETMDEGKGQAARGETIAIIGQAHRQDRKRQKRAGVAAAVEHADGQTSHECEDRPERNQATDQCHRNAHVIEIRRNDSRCRVALDRHRDDGHQKFGGAEFHTIQLFSKTFCSSTNSPERFLSAVEMTVESRSPIVISNEVRELAFKGRRIEPSTAEPSR